MEKSWKFSRLVKTKTLGLKTKTLLFYFGLEDYITGIK